MMELTQAEFLSRQLRYERDEKDREIERLRNRLHDEASLAEDRKLEIKRLRAALRKIANLDEREGWMLDDAWDIAKEALEDDTEGGDVNGET